MSGKWMLVGAGMLIVMVLGYLLTRSDKPFPALLLTVHKLIPVAVVVFLVITLVRANREAALSADLWITAAVTILFYLGAIATGGLVSMEKEMPEAVHLLHHYLPYLCLLSTAAMAFLLLR